jgi:hypothetical protein
MDALAELPSNPLAAMTGAPRRARSARRVNRHRKLDGRETSRPKGWPATPVGVTTTTHIIGSNHLMKLVSSAVLTLAALLSGCAYNASPYGASVRNVEVIKSANLKPVAVATFQAAKPGQSTITCRAAGPVTVTPSFEAYIQKAFVDELKLAGAYDPASAITLSGKLEQVDFSSGITDGNWSFTLMVSNNKNDGFTTTSKFPFSGSFVADKACQEVAQAFQPAVQKLIEDVVRNPKFKTMTN